MIKFKYIFVILSTILISKSVQSQNECATPTPTIDFLQNIIGAKQLPLNNATFNVVIHIIKKE